MSSSIQPDIVLEVERILTEAERRERERRRAIEIRLLVYREREALRKATA